MPEESGSRKLAAIMFTDVKSFSKKMGENEEAAMELLRTHDAIMKQVVEKFGGKVIKSIGDSFMVDFSSAVNAVRCAIEAQETFWNHNQGKSEFEKIEIRVGIHLGDVIIVDNDIFGDGVNIAARIEAITEPNRICISQDIYNQVKNKMQINVYSIGSMELKNIAEPVEVFEILLESIPELSKPSASALKVLSRKIAETVSKQEAQEAKKVEEAKQRVAEERRKAEEEKQKKIQVHYDKAQAHLKARELDQAEAEIKEIYKIVAIHPGAQMIRMRIDEERFRIAEEERKKRIEEENRKLQERTRLIDERLKKAIDCVEGNQLAEALAILQKVFELDPNHAQAKQIEEQIKQLEQAKIELERSQVLSEEQEKKGSLEAEAQLEEHKRIQPIAPTRPQPSRKGRKNLVIPMIAGLGGLIAVVVVLFIAVPDFQKIFSQRGGSLAVLPFSVQQSSTGEEYLGDAIAALCAENLGRSQDLTVIAPFTAATFRPGKATSLAVAKELGVQYVITGSVSHSNGQVTLDLQVIEAENGESVWTETFEGDIVSSTLWSDVLRALSQEFGVSGAVEDVRVGTAHRQAYQAYLKATWMIERGAREGLGEAETLLKSALELDQGFPQAHAALAHLWVEQFKFGRELDKSLLRDAIQSAQAALRLNPNLAQAHATIGEASRFLQHLAEAKSHLTKSITLQPNQSEAMRQLALVALIEGEMELASGYASTALKLDPKHYETHIVLGLLRQLQNQFSPALAAYEQAIALGGNDSLITTRYRFGAWSGEYLHDRIGNYCLLLLQKYPDDYKLYSWLGRAYQGSGRGLESLNFLGRGIALTKKLLELDPNNAHARAYQGFMLYSSGKVEQGVEDIEKAASLLEGTATEMYWRARIRAIQNNKAEALEWLKKAVQIEFIFSEVLNSDFTTLARDPEFFPAIARKSASPPQATN